MTGYQSILLISVMHEYYNANSDGLAPFEIIPDRETAVLLRQFGILLKSARGFTQLIAETERFEDLAELTDKITLKFHLISTAPAIRSITKMPGMFNISTINAEFTDSPALDITAENWADINPSNTTIANNDVAVFNKNLISILTITLPQRHLTLEKKSVTVRFNAISASWKYYIFSSDGKKNLGISHLFTEQPNEKIANKTARVFLSDNPISLREVYTEYFSLSDDKKIIMKSLPLPAPENISTFISDGIKKSIAHIYIN